MIEINKEKCIGCGACVKDCPGKALGAEGQEGRIYPQMYPVRALCGHLSGECGVHSGL